MKKAMLLLLAVFSLSVMAEGQAEKTKSFKFSGQNVESFDLVEDLIETKYRDEIVDSTCTRQEPYETTVCRNVTRYRKECRDIPGRNDCRQVPYQVCRNVTKYRTKCRNLPGDTVCRNVTKYRTKCTTSPGRKVCKVQRGQKCRKDSNGRKICKPFERRTCHNEPGQRRCTKVPYTDRVCSTKPGRRVCKDVPYTDRVCRTDYRRECRWIPGRTECRDIPYNDRVCSVETRYRDVQYACKKTIQVPYTEKVGEVIANLEFLFENPEVNANVLFSTSLNNKEVTLDVVDESKKPVLVVAQRKHSEGKDGNNYKITTSYKVKLIKAEKYLAPVSKEISGIKLKREKISFTTGKLASLNKATLSLSISKDDKTYINRALKEEEVSLEQLDNGDTKVVVDFEKLGFELPKGLFSSYKFNVNINIKLDPKGKVLNQNAPSLEQNKSVKLKAK